MFTTMESEAIDVSSDANHEVKDEICEEVKLEAVMTDCLPIDSVVKGESVAEDIEAPVTTSSEMDADNGTSAMSSDVGLNESLLVNAMASVASVNTKNRSLVIQSKSIVRNHVDGTIKSSGGRSTDRKSGVKRSRITVEQQEPSVHVNYKSLNRESKRKLEELLQQWSRWHTQNCSSSNDSNVELVSGEETYYPALRIGLDKPSAVTFWVDSQTDAQSSKEFEPLDGTSVPFYDRGYSLALSLDDGSNNSDRIERMENSRCFNCGSYSHGLKDCAKPRDNAAVNKARKENNTRRNQSANSRNSVRYYQSSRPGKYDGLVPGVLDPETRLALGLGELDPPPWLHRMREIGYPPGYLEADDEDEPSGITIFGEEENEKKHKEESEEGEILDENFRETSPKKEPSRTKMSVEYPGINAAIPEKADARLWTAGFTPHSRDHHHSNRSRNHSYSSETPRYHESSSRWSSRDMEDDDDGPPGCEPGTSPSLSYHFRRHGDYESSRFSSDRGRWSP